MAFGNKRGDRDRDRERSWDRERGENVEGLSEGGIAGNIPPHDLDAERAVLGGILLESSALATAEAVVMAADFYHPGHALIFEAIQSLSAQRAGGHRDALGGA